MNLAHFMAKVGILRKCKLGSWGFQPMNPFLLLHAPVKFGGLPSNLEVCISPTIELRLEGGPLGLPFASVREKEREIER